MDWIWSGILLSGLVLVIVFSEFVRKQYQLSIGATRKFVHVVTGLLIAITPFLLKRPYPLLIISGSFILLNIVAIKMGWMPGMHASQRLSYGTVFYPVSFFVLVLLFWEHHKAILGISMLIMAIADAMAAMVGENINHPIHYRLAGELKSVQGSLIMFLMTSLITLIGLRVFSKIDNLSISLISGLWMAAVVGIMATACESTSCRGSDNLTVPLGAAFILHFMMTHSISQNLIFTFGIGFALLIVLPAYLLNFLSGSGAIATFLLGVVVFGTGKWEFSVPILLFFVLSSLLSKLGKKWKRKFSDTFQKGGRRDLGQVFANGGVAGIIVLAWNYFPDDAWYFAFVGSIAAVTADTWATEIGVFSKIAPRNILNLKRVLPGTSGGVTWLGFTGGFLGSFIIVYMGSLVTSRYDHLAQGTALFVVIIGVGLLGSIIDSILGTTIQAQYQCSICGKITEKKHHCQGTTTALISGFHIIDNDMVNAICALSGALLAWLAYQFLI